ncbi:unnamed protein product [Penicillium discolor]
MTVTETALVTTADSRGRRTPPIPGRRRRYTADQVTLPRVILRTAAGFLVLAIFVLPYLIMFFGSVKTKAQIRSVDPTYLPVEWHWENYLTMWSTPETPLPYNLVSTIVISVFATLLVLLVSLPAAYYTARFRFPGRMVFLFLEVDEAAQIDGAGRLTVLFRINLPLVWPGIVTAIVFTFVACWNEFAASLVILSTDKNQPLSVALTKFVGQYETSWQYVFGVSIVAILPVIILFMLIEKRLVGGLTAGSVK